jgi:outer membrane lipoprotein SlyB
MDTTNQHPMAQPGLQPSFSERIRSSKALIPTMAVMLVAVAALATTLVVTRTNAQNGAAEMATADVPATTAVVTAPKQSVAATQPQARVTTPAVAPSVPKPRVQPAPVQVAQNVCQVCGVVESSTPVQRQGRVNGIGNSEIGVGTVAGGVLGGILGNQIGGGSGKTAATVLGAAGGAYAGNRIEKNMSKVTVYQMRIRMNDGSYRTIEQSNGIAAGSRVVVEGDTVRVAS